VRRDALLHSLAVILRQRSEHGDLCPVARALLEEGCSPEQIAAAVCALEASSRERRKSGLNGFARAHGFGSSDAGSANARRVTICHAVTRRDLLP